MLQDTVFYQALIIATSEGLQLEGGVHTIRGVGHGKSDLGRFEVCGPYPTCMGYVNATETYPYSIAAGGARGKHVSCDGC